MGIKFRFIFVFLLTCLSVWAASAGRGLTISGYKRRLSLRARDQCARARPMCARGDQRARARPACPGLHPTAAVGPPAHLVHELGRVSWPGLNFSLRLVSRQVVCQSAGALWVDRERPRVSRAQWAVVQMLALQDTERVAQIGHFELHATSEICASTHCVASYLARVASYLARGNRGSAMGL